MKLTDHLSYKIMQTAFHAPVVCIQVFLEFWALKQNNVDISQTEATKIH